MSVLVSTFYAGQAVFLSYFSGEIQRSISSVGNTNAIFFLMVIIFVLWAYCRPIIIQILDWIWYDRDPLSSSMQDDKDYETQYDGNRWGSKYMEATVMKLLEAGSQFLLQVVFAMGVVIIFDYWDVQQYSIFDEVAFVFIFLATLYAFLGIVEETEIN